MPDVSFLIDTMTAENRDVADPFAGRLDEEHASVVGHSFGAMTAIGSAAGWAGADPDPRVVAIVAVSGVIEGELQQDDRSGPNAGFNVGAADLVDPYRSTCGPDAVPIDEAVRLQNLYTVSFLQRHQVGDERYGWHLTDEGAAREPDVELDSR